VLQHLIVVCTCSLITGLAAACLALPSQLPASAAEAPSTPGEQQQQPLSTPPATALRDALLLPGCGCAVLGAFGEKEAALLGAVWDMVLVYLKVGGVHRCLFIFSL
jgi:hypothetical protein